MIKNKWTVKIILLVTVILAGLILHKHQFNGIQMQKQIIKKYILQCLMLIKKIIWIGEMKQALKLTLLTQSNGFEVPKVEGRAILYWKRRYSCYEFKYV